jgi:hypothetical protein
VVITQQIAERKQKIEDGRRQTVDEGQQKADGLHLVTVLAELLLECMNDTLGRPHIAEEVLRDYIYFRTNGNPTEKNRSNEREVDIKIEFKIETNSKSNFKTGSHT